ncbi:hypothetical protein [Clostridium frigidicarnis]|uniref:Prepilin-type N-terminal cleavage/methylation domain-containing protein n=1 Tax=Clostridium frigidicarnis TaxID=84698 RepID=A0A1I0WH50_9CLOT|nr:hypothetical protein [Clostridium frigidicarnis]SFA87971.1 hypothetical protein SAMN04488528_100591 [Clostridium frigidicarnis]
MVNGLKDNKNGFTLVEIIAGMSLTLMLLFLMSSFIFNTIKCYKKVNEVKLEDEYLRQSIICIQKNLENLKEINVSEKQVEIKNLKNQMKVALNSSDDLVIKYNRVKKEEILARNIEDLSFYEKNNLLYINIKNKNGGEIMWSIPINIL